MKIKELIKILSSFSEKEQGKEIRIDSYGNPVEIVAVRPDQGHRAYIITFHKGL